MGCECTNVKGKWCLHSVALCLFRFNFPDKIEYRPPVSESLSKLDRNKLQKFAQYLLNELPKSHLSLAQEILDQLLKNHFDQIDGGPDPTAGATVETNHEWLLDSTSLQERIKRTLTKFCSPSPIVSDPNYFNTYDSIFQQEYTYLSRALRNREPQGIWSLLKIGKESNFMSENR